MFEERMKSIEQKNIAKTKFKTPVVATIGRFSTAFRRFESKEERRHSLDMSVVSAPSIKAEHSTISASLSTSVEPKRRQSPSKEQKKLPRIPYHPSFSEKPTQQSSEPNSELRRTSINRKTSSSKSEETVSPTRLTRTPVFPDTSPQGAVSKGSRAVNIPVKESRLMRNVRDSCNAPDVVAATLQPDRPEQQERELAQERHHQSHHAESNRLELENSQRPSQSSKRPSSMTSEFKINHRPVGATQATSPARFDKVCYLTNIPCQQALFSSDILF